MKELDISDEKIPRGENLENTSDPPEKKKLKDLDKYIIFSFTMIIIYTIIDKVTFLLTGGMESSTLTTVFFSVFGGEVLLCALIKRLKLKKEENNDLGSNEDASHMEE